MSEIKNNAFKNGDDLITFDDNQRNEDGFIVGKINPDVLKGMYEGNNTVITDKQAQKNASAKSFGRRSP